MLARSRTPELSTYVVEKPRVELRREYPKVGWSGASISAKTAHNRCTNLRLYFEQITERLIRARSILLTPRRR
jgi:hypothetical protein